jgi:septal ring factor EnvC (AmiA/AmiB activator)
MAKAKGEPTSGSDFEPQVGDEGAATTEAAAVDNSKQLQSLEAGLKEALQEISSLQKTIKKLEDRKPEAVQSVEIGSSDPRKDILDRAAVIAGKIASGSVLEGLLSGSHATTISLSSIRLATMLERVAEKIEAHPELLTEQITKAHDKLDEMIRAENTAV